MGKKVPAAILTVILLLSLGVYAGYQYHLNRVNGVQPLRIMVDGTRYVICGTIENRPDSPPDGTIKEVIEAIDYPDKEGQANFGTVGMPYWQTGEEIVVEAGKYYVFNESQHQE